jgi:UDP-N-acetylmuramate--alanine ligase
MMKMARVHLVGIGGSGLSAIAVLLLERGIAVSGSDRQLSPLSQRVEAAGGQVFIGHRAENVAGADLVVRSSAIPDDNVEIQAARAAGIPVFKRSEFLGELTADHRTIAIAGTHGKTTTTAMIAWVLAFLGYDPSYIIGGLSQNLGKNAHHGRGDFFVIEADEYDGMFLGLNPDIAVVTNIEHDHPDCYPTPQDFFQAFAAFRDRIRPAGTLIACQDDPGAEKLLALPASQSLRMLNYGVHSQECDFTARHLQAIPGAGYAFQAQGMNQTCSVALQVPGLHNVLNALAALAVGAVLEIDLEQVAKALASYQGTGRRFEIRGQAQGVIVIDDYAHHPAEIRATLAAARSRYPGQPLWAVWQPHTYSRTRLLAEDFARAFGDADHVLVLEIYAAREPAPADGYSAARVVSAMHHPAARYSPGLDQAQEFLLASLQPGSVVLVLSAGDAEALSANLLSALRSDERRIGLN